MIEERTARQWSVKCGNEIATLFVWLRIKLASNCVTRQLWFVELHWFMGTIGEQSVLNKWYGGFLNEWKTHESLLWQQTDTFVRCGWIKISTLWMTNANLLALWMDGLNLMMCRNLIAGQYYIVFDFGNCIRIPTSAYTVNCWWALVYLPFLPRSVLVIVKAQ